MTLRVGIVGAGSIARRHGLAYSLMPDVDLTVHDVAGAADFAKTYGGREVDSLDALLDSCDVVDVITPTATHAEIVEAALKTDCDVIVEKPMARTADEARRLVHLAQERGRRIFPAHVVRYFPAYRQAHDTIASGGLGEMAVLRFTRTGPYPLDRGWYSDFEVSGGILLDQMIHDLDQASWLAGPVSRVYATRVEAETGQPAQTVHVVLTHASGAVSHCRGLWGPQKMPFWYTFALSGKTGTLKLDSRLENGFQLTRSADAPSQVVIGELYDDPYVAELTDFIGAIREGRDAAVSMQDGLTAVALAEAAEESIRTGQPVDVTAELNEGSN